MLILKDKAEKASANKIRSLITQIEELDQLREELISNLEREVAAYTQDSSDSDDESSAFKRSPFVFPRIGAEKKRAIYAPRIGRSQAATMDSMAADKRAIYAPRIGRSQESSDEKDAEKRAIYNPRIGK